MTTPSLSILVVSYNTRDMTLACLRSVFEQTKNTSFELLVIDNQSSDGSADAIKAEFGERITLIRSDVNLGFARANNLAAAHAAGEYLLLLNPDTVVLDGGIDKLVDFAARHPEAGIWGGRTVFADGSLNPTSCWRHMSLWTLFCQTLGLTALFPHNEQLNPEPYGRWQRDNVRHVDIVTGCFLLITRQLWERLGGFSSTYFMYAEEADLCRRAAALNAKPLITPDATIIHHGSASDPDRAEKCVAVLRGRVTLMRDHWRPYARWLGVAMSGMLTCMRAICYTGVGEIIRNDRYRARGRMWRRVVGRWREWSRGYPRGAC